MNNIGDLLGFLNNGSPNKEEATPNIPREILDQYPYGQFPVRYTKAGQENIRKESENRFSYKEEPQPPPPNDSPNILELLPLIQMLSGKKDSKEMFKTLSKFLFKGNKELEKLFELIQPCSIKSQELKSKDEFPDTDKVKISSLKRIE